VPKGVADPSARARARHPLRRPGTCDGLASPPGPRRPGAEASDGANSELETAPRSWKQVSQPAIDVTERLLLLAICETRDLASATARPALLSSRYLCYAPTRSRANRLRCHSGMGVGVPCARYSGRARMCLNCCRQGRDPRIVITRMNRTGRSARLVVRIIGCCPRCWMGFVVVCEDLGWEVLGGLMSSLAVVRAQG
jgi:hypothetical protein